VHIQLDEVSQRHGLLLIYLRLVAGTNLSASPGIPAAMEGIGLRPSFVCATHLLHAIGLAGLMEADRSSLIPGGGYQTPTTTELKEH
jgi:hypothetical protein